MQLIFGCIYEKSKIDKNFWQDKVYFITQIMQKY